MDKIQVGENVWIKPNRGCAVPSYGQKYYYIGSQKLVNNEVWQDDTFDYALLHSGNFFPTREAAESAIIKPADPTPITYEQWVAANKRYVFLIASDGSIVDWGIPKYVPRFVFATNLCWLTRESAQAWLDKWNAEHGVKE